MTVIGEPWTFKRSGLTAPTRTLKSAMVSDMPLRLLPETRKES